MSNNSVSLTGLREFAKRNLFRRRLSEHGEEEFIVTLDDSPQQIFEKLIKKSYSFVDTTAAVGDLGSVNDDPAGQSGLYYYLNPTYTDAQNAMLEDAWRNDAVVNNGMNKFVYGIMGKHGRTVLDTALEFNNDKDRREEISKVVKEARNVNAKQNVDKVLTSAEVDFFTTFTEMVEEYFVFGRSASFRLTDPELGILNGLIHLDPKRLGRVRIRKDNLRIDAVEYKDCIVSESGKIMIALQSESKNETNTEVKPAFIPIDQLLYLVHNNGSIVSNSKYLGFSKLEGIIHISQVKRIILNEMLKESAKALYAGIGLVKVPPDVDDALLTTFIYNVKRAVGRWFGYKIAAEFDIKDFKPAIEKFVAVVDLINREILRCIGLASFLVGYEQIANYANSEQIMLATREMDITHIRTRLRDFIKHNLLDPLFVFYLGFNNPTGKQIFNNQRAINEKRFSDIVDIPKEDLDAFYTETLQNANVKLVYEFAEVNFSTKLELAQMFDIVKRIVPQIPSEAILRNLGLDEYIEEVASAEAEDKALMDKVRLAAINGGGTETEAQTGGDGESNNNNKSSASLNARRMMNTAVASMAALDPDIKAAYLDYLKTGTALRKKVLDKEKENQDASA